MRAIWKLAIALPLSASVVVGCTRTAEPPPTVSSSETPAPTVSSSETPAVGVLPSGTIVFGRWERAVKDQVLFTVNPDGSDLHQVIPGKPVATECPHWSPDASRILACSGVSLVHSAARDAVGQVIDPATGRSRNLVPSPKPGALFGCNRLSPDGKRLLCGQYDQPAGIFSVRYSDLGDLTRITSNPGGTDEALDYSPDGRQVFFARTHPDRHAAWYTAFFVVNVDGTGLRRITPWLLPDSTRIDEGSWSPDGKWILYDRDEQIHVVRPDGSDDHVIQIDVPGSEDALALYPDWSPDGRWIVFSMSLPGEDVLNLYVMRADGSDVRQITKARPGRPGEGDEYPDWGVSPSSKIG